ncbi:MAG: nucleotide exchange factor GrpE [Deltaproteobacteria bacterium]|nr:nucleotide exchange factor GrpE [Deltaproteobacteria bacterium]
MVDETKVKDVTMPINRTPARVADVSGETTPEQKPEKHVAPSEERHEPESEAEILKGLAAEAEENADRWPKAAAVLRIVKDAGAASDDEWVQGRAQCARLMVELAKEAFDKQDRWMRAVAELDNFRKRSAQEREKLLKYRNEELLLDLLPVLDNFERAMEHSEHSGALESFVEGVRMIAQMLTDALTKHGVKKIESLGSAFDPTAHEAIAAVPAVGQEPNTVIDVVEDGYMYQDRLLRPARVVVAAGRG